MPGEGLEPPTFGLQNRCTAAVLARQDGAGAGGVLHQPLLLQLSSIS